MTKTLRSFESVEPFEATLPISGHYLTQAMLIARAGMNRQIEALDPDKRECVSQACRSIGFTDEETVKVLATTCDLICFEARGRDLIPTDAERFEIIEFIRDTSAQLAQAMEDLPAFWDGLELRNSFRDVTRELGKWDRQEIEWSRMPDVLTFAVLAQAADRLLTTKQGLKGKGGRRPLRAAYFRYVASLAASFESMGLPVGRGGAFERLCTVVFDVAGVRATPEGAIRYYLTEWKKRAQKSPENSTTKAAE